jgi:hypothetical protein
MKGRTIYCNPRDGGCGVSVEEKAEIVDLPDRCKGPGHGKECPVDVTWKAIKRERARQEAAKTATGPQHTIMAG